MIIFEIKLRQNSGMKSKLSKLMQKFWQPLKLQTEMEKSLEKKSPQY
jgi:hypothetical protein